MKKILTAFAALLLSVSLGFAAHLAFALDEAVLANPETTSVNTEGSGAGTDANANTNTDAETADNSVLSFTLEEAIKYAETGNPSLRLADSRLAILDRQNEQAWAVQRVVIVQDIDSRKAKELNHKRAHWTLDNAKHDREVQLKDLRVQITNSYQNILALQQQVDNYTAQLANLDTVISQINLQIELGLRIPTEVLAYTAQKSALEAAQKAVLSSADSAMIVLKQDLGIDVNREIVLTSELMPYTKFDDSDLEEMIAEAIRNHYDYQRYERDIEITDIEYRINFQFSDPATDQVELSIEDKKGTLANLPVNLEVGFRTAYNNIKSLENTIAANELTLEADQINIGVMQKNIDVGRAGDLEMISLQNTLLSNRLTLQQNVIAHTTAVENLKNSLTVSKN